MRLAPRGGTYWGGFMSTSDDKHESRRRTSFRVRLHQKAQLTLPEEVRHVLRAGEGDEVEFTIEGNGRVTVCGYTSIPADQARFSTPERLAGKRQEDYEIATDEGKVHGSCAAMFVYLNNLGAAES